MNENNFDMKKLTDEIIKKSGGKINQSGIDKAKSGDISAIVSALPEKEREKLKALLNDKSAAQKILGSKKAQEILNSITKKNNNGRH